MKENPPYSLPEIRLLLSEYLDGGLEPDKVVEIELLIEQYPQYKEELLKLQASRDALRSTMTRHMEGDLQFSKASDAVWQSIAKKLEADAGTAPASFDEEFISAYYDGEIPKSDPAFQAFESQLYNNPESNRMLAGFGSVSEVVRQFGYRLEESCTVDVTRQVMDTYMTEEGLMPAEAVSASLGASKAVEGAPDSLEGDSNSMAETVSAYFDQELNARETIEANRLIENDPAARRLLGRFNWISEQIRSVVSQIQEQAPDFWPPIHEELERQLDDGTVVPFNREKRVKGMLRIALPAAAAAILVILALPVTQMTPGTANETAYKSSRSELATVPVNARSRQMMDISTSGGNGAGASFDDAAFAPAAAPQANPAAEMVLQPEESVDQRAGSKTPSSEEYLFNALSEQMPEEDISAILGQ